ncbi:MAG: formate dehydrogenase subunit alpha [Chloroflexi bacterium]|nr:formate dehydrogenase subunit alpha [Chloroflexota bacterium]
MADGINLTINEKPVVAQRGMTVLEAARANGIYIPTLCWHRDMKPFGACRICLVQIEKMPGFPASCTTPVSEGMIVRTETPEVQQLRRQILALLITEHPNVCLTCWRLYHCDPTMVCLRSAGVTPRCVLCPKNKRCELQEVSHYVNLHGSELPFYPKGYPVNQQDPYYDREYNYCIVCARCVRMCDEVRNVQAISMTSRGNPTVPGTLYNVPLVNSRCIFCGACVDACPCAALLERSGRWDGFTERTVTTTCPYCGVGCVLDLAIKNDKIVRCTPNRDAPANRGQACVRGRFSLDFAQSPQRLTTPLIRRDGKLEPASWDEALNLVASKLAEHKGDSFAMLTSAKATNEDNYVAMKFARAVMQTNNVDHCARLCHATTVAGLTTALGIGAMSNSMDDIAQAKCILAVGTNTTANHSVLELSYTRARNKGAKLIVINPRWIDICKDATLFLQVRPGTDIALVGAMMKLIVDEGLEDRKFIEERCENYEEFKNSLQAFDLETVSRTTGVPADRIAQAARTFAASKPAVITWATGITQHEHGTENVLALADLALLTGNLGMPGSGVSPLWGHNNLQGATDMGAIPSSLTGGQHLDNTAVRDKFEKTWACSLPAGRGLTSTEVLPHAVEQSKVRAMLIMGERVAQTHPDATRVSAALKRLDFLVVQDLFLTEEAQLADVVLPACSFAEKDGTFTNTERRVQRVRQCFEPKGESKADWWTISQLAQRMGAQGFGYTHPSQVMDEIARLTPDWAGISYERLDKAGVAGIQWPCPTADHPGTRSLHAEGVARGKGLFTPLAERHCQEPPTSDFPLTLTTGRSYWHFDTDNLMDKSPGFAAIKGNGHIEINPDDAGAMGISDGELVRVVSRRGEVNAPARISLDCPPGLTWMLFHYPDPRANILTNPALDPSTKLPEYKGCAVRVEKIQ